MGTRSVCVLSLCKDAVGVFYSPDQLGLEGLGTHTHTHIYIYIYIGGARGVMVLVVGNGHGDTSSNSGRVWLHFT